jgi:hypothetical protein
MQSAVQVIGSFFAAALGWVILEFVGRPLRKFYDLRGEVIRRLTHHSFVSGPRHWRRLAPSPTTASRRRWLRDRFALKPAYEEREHPMPQSQQLQK